MLTNVITPPDYLRAEPITAPSFARASYHDRESGELAGDLETEQERIRELRDMGLSVFKSSAEYKLWEIANELQDRRANCEEIRREQGRRVAATTPSEQETELTREIGELLKQESRLQRDEAGWHGVLPERYIVAGAVQECDDEIATCEAEKKRILEPYRSGNSSYGGRVADELGALDRKIEEWKKHRKLAAVGEEVALIRAKRQRLIAERDELAAARREAVLAD